MQARWIRLGALGQREFDAAWASLAAVQARTAVPILLWAEEAARYPFALIAPLKFAPGRKDRWLSWGLASAVGAVSGIMVAPILLLEPNMMQTIIIYAFAAAVLGGIESPLGAVVGGLIVGVTVNLAGAYVPFVGGDLELAVALAIIVGVLVLKPNGLFGRAAVRNV